MAINIHHVYTTHVEIIYYPNAEDSRGLHESTVANMDEIAEHVCEVLIKHNFIYADVCSAETGEILMTIERA